jgi:DNA-binding NarL/FixJ family response regulator
MQHSLACKLVPVGASSARHDWHPLNAIDARATTVANANAAPVDHALPRVWEELVACRLRVSDERIAGDHVELGVTVPSHPQPLTSIETMTLMRVLCGEPQKIIAVERASAASTVSNHFAQALKKLGFGARLVPLSLVLAGLARSGIARAPCALRMTLSDGGLQLVLTVARPAMARIDELTVAERHVAQLLIEGRTRWEIARARSTALNTVSRQCHGIYRAFGVTGRYALVRRAAERGCFE